MKFVMFVYRKCSVSLRKSRICKFRSWTCVSSFLIIWSLSPSILFVVFSFSKQTTIYSRWNLGFTMFKSGGQLLFYEGGVIELGWALMTFEATLVSLGALLSWFVASMSILFFSISMILCLRVLIMPYRSEKNGIVQQSMPKQPRKMSYLCRFKKGLWFYWDRWKEIFVVFRCSYLDMVKMKVCYYNTWS